jgi:hypothetical protein
MVGSRMRFTCVRLVFNSRAILFLEVFFFCIAFAICQATTSFTAWDWASSKAASSSRKSPILEPMCFLLIVATPS